MSMALTSSYLMRLSEGTRSVHLLKIGGYHRDTFTNSSYHATTTCEVDGYGWEIRFYPWSLYGYHITLQLVFLSEAVANRNYRDLTIECAITVFKDLDAIPVPSSNVHQHLVDLLETETGVDVMFIVLAARSPVFMAEFFGEMKEKTLCVEIKEMEATVFKAMLYFIYTDMVPELDDNNETPKEMAEHLLVAADRLDLDYRSLNLNTLPKRLVVTIDYRTMSRVGFCMRRLELVS
ncbi:hypothetical protein QOZ80_5AG0391250 [Eleusine coracana subsp. coracana]|nr:hypothetical protein QOZ80_5AG0391250 [Eleusine coracana subsp. coracana]